MAEVACWASDRRHRAEVQFEFDRELCDRTRVETSDRGGQPPAPRRARSTSTTTPCRPGARRSGGSRRSSDCAGLHADAALSGSATDVDVAASPRVSPPSPSPSTTRCAARRGYVPTDRVSARRLARRRPTSSSSTSRARPSVDEPIVVTVTGTDVDDRGCGPPRRRRRRHRQGDRRRSSTRARPCSPTTSRSSSATAPS